MAMKVQYQKRKLLVEGVVTKLGVSALENDIKPTSTV